MCFEILGFDILIDSKHKPWLLEVNHAPSFACESEVDRVVKSAVLRDSLKIINCTPEGRKKWKQQTAINVVTRALGKAERERREEERLRIEREKNERGNAEGMLKCFILARWGEIII
jgi:hypothetical protein